MQFIAETSKMRLLAINRKTTSVLNPELNKIIHAPTPIVSLLTILQHLFRDRKAERDGLTSNNFATFVPRPKGGTLGLTSNNFATFVPRPKGKRLALF
jgi:hypothetical protein